MRELMKELEIAQAEASALKQTVNEILSANIQMRTGAILMQNEITRLQKEIEELKKEPEDTKPKAKEEKVKK